MRKPIEESAKQGADLMLLLVSVLIFALSINLISSYVASCLSTWRGWTVLVLGIAMFCFGIVVVLRIFPIRREYVFRYKGGISYKIEKGRVIEIPVAGYNFNRDFVRYLKGFLYENPVFLKYIEKRQHVLPEAGLRFDPCKNSQLSLLSSVLELVVLEKLSLHLNAYFIEHEMDHSQILCLERKDFGRDVLNNKVLEAISKDIEDRNAFADCSAGHGEIFAAIGPNGAIYERVSIELPPSSRLFRGEDGFLIISTNMFTIKIIPIVAGFNTNINPVLLPQNLNGHYCPLQACVKIVIRINGYLFHKATNRDMYAWLDSFAQELDEYVSIDKLEKKMNVEFLEFIENYKVDKAKGPEVCG